MSEDRVGRALELEDPARFGRERSLRRIGGSGQLGRPSLDGSRLVYARADRRENVIVRRNETLWSTALRAKRAYVNQISGSLPQQQILSVNR